MNNFIFFAALTLCLNAVLIHFALVSLGKRLKMIKNVVFKDVGKIEVQLQNTVTTMLLGSLLGCYGLFSWAVNFVFYALLIYLPTYRIQGIALLAFVLLITFLYTALKMLKVKSPSILNLASKVVPEVLLVWVMIAAWHA